MRSFLAAAAIFIAFGAAPGQARDYPWCERTSFNGFNPSCSFTSYQQCMATVSGQRGDCILNPRLAFDQQNRRRARDRQDNGWNLTR